jgi:CDP-diacylglycerol pyrophosphatase
MKTLITAAFVIALAGAAQAMPVAPIAADGLTTLVAQGCGPGMRRNERGRCRPAYMARPCAPGMRRNVVGRCVPRR